MVSLAIVGDIHRHFSAADVAYFNQSAYDLILFTGDLANYRHRHGWDSARLMGELTKPALFVPGNHDAVTPWQLLAEIWQSPLLARLSSWGHERRAQALRRQLGNVVMGGYSFHPFLLGGQRFDVIVGRPHSMGGRFFSYRPYLQRCFQVDTFAASTERLRRCADSAQADTIIFLAHNGPYGLGSARNDIWGCDFSEEEGDFGDLDLQQAIVYARAQGKRVAAVIAGHMHHRLKGGGRRRWLLEQDGTCYINAARVPRIFTENGRACHHHVAMRLEAGHLEVEEVLIEFHEKDLEL